MATGIPPRNPAVLPLGASCAEDFSSYDDEWWHFYYGNQFWAFQKQKPSAIYGEIVP
ncbi:MAG: hypothetical protein HYT77_00095 [Deltaproteobacteria bacterium]|nr:hypothetical protein [Deltaproteobacteria bacterium]